MADHTRPASADGPFHEGERRVQARAGEGDRAVRTGRVIGPAIPAGAIPFLAQRPMLVAATAGASGDLWVSTLFGGQGLTTAPDPRTVVIDRELLREDPRDPLWENLTRDPRIGLLSIDLGTRRRLRVNGHVTELDGAQVRIAVDEAYPNCPKYIQRRHLVVDPGPPPAHPPRTGTHLDAPTRARIAAADTLFVGSQNPRGHLDASHRGGAPGFVQVLDDRTLRVPDYPGNSLFNTLGNFELYPRAALTFPGFGDGLALCVQGDVVLRFDLDDTAGLTGGTGRAWDVRVDRWTLRAVPARLHCELLEESPFNVPIPPDRL